MSLVCPMCNGVEFKDGECPFCSGDGKVTWSRMYLWLIGENEYKRLINGRSEEANQ